MRPVFIHIGLPKCGSTYLKRASFARVSKNLVIPRGNLFRSLKSESADITQIRTTVFDTCSDPDDPVIVTNEGLSGDMWSSTYSEAVATNLATAFPEGHVILFLREQFSYLRSIYLYSILGGKQTQTFSRFLRRHQKTVVDKLKYHDLIQLYHDRFGADRVHVFLFEMIRQDEDQLHLDLRQLLGSDYIYDAPESRKNQSINDQRTVAVLRKSNLVMKWIVRAETRIKLVTGGNHNQLRTASNQFSVQNPVARLVAALFHDGLKIDVPEDFRSAFTETFQDSNRIVEKTLGIDLSAYRYLT